MSYEEEMRKYSAAEQKRQKFLEQARAQKKVLNDKKRKARNHMLITFGSVVNKHLKESEILEAEDLEKIMNAAFAVPSVRNVMEQCIKERKAIIAKLDEPPFDITDEDSETEDE